MLRENTYGSIAISILFAVAALTHWQAGAGWLSAHLGERISQVSAHAARGQAWSIPAAGAVCSGQAGWARTWRWPWCSLWAWVIFLEQWWTSQIER